MSESVPKLTAADLDGGPPEGGHSDHRDWIEPMVKVGDRMMDANAPGGVPKYVDRT